MFRCLFMYISNGNDPEIQKADLDRAGTQMFFRGVPDYETAERLAAEYTRRGLDAVELCGGFGIEGTARVKIAVREALKGSGNGPVAVGSVRHDGDPAFGGIIGGDEVYGHFAGAQSIGSGMGTDHMIPGEKLRVGFIYISEGQDPDRERADIHGPGLVFSVRGVSSYAEAEKAAADLVNEGCCMVELCAGFGIEGEYRVKRAMGAGVPCGAVKFDYHPHMGFKSGDDLPENYRK